MKRIKISVIFGTRPEAIKLAPLILELKKQDWISLEICVTGQHREMLDQVLRIFKIIPDADLSLMKPNQELAEFTADAIIELNKHIKQSKPDLIIVQGDTSTVLSTSLAAFYNNIPIAHVEAGLRTFNLQSPWPEEANRVITSHLSTFHFAPTERSKNNLIREGINPESIFLVGNTVVDALFYVVKLIDREPELYDKTLYKSRYSNIILLTGHRREKFGAKMLEFCQAIVELAKRLPYYEFVYPVHLNPNVQEPVKQVIGKANCDNINLIDPLDYIPFVDLMRRSKIIITDSGGIQEEAPSFGVPVLVTRDNTERPEAIEFGTSILVGTSSDALIKEVLNLVENQEDYNKMSKKNNPFGDGKASLRIVNIIKRYFGFD